MKQIYLLILLLTVINLKAQTINIAYNTCNSANGDYILTSDFNGRPTYTKDPYIIQWNGERWIHTTISDPNNYATWNLADTPNPPASSFSAWNSYVCNPGEFTGDGTYTGEINPCEWSTSTYSNYGQGGVNFRNYSYENTLIYNIAANDLQIESGNDFTLESINLNALIYNGCYEDNVEYLDIYIYEDNDGQPGSLLASQLAVVPVSMVYIRNYFSWNLFDVKLDIDDILLASDPLELKTYWIGASLKLDGIGSCSENALWQGSDLTLGNSTYQSSDDGVTWSSSGSDGYYTFNGTCQSELNVEENSLKNFTHYPNPVVDELIIVAKSNIQQVTIYNILGKEVMRKFPNKANLLLDMSSFKAGIYFIYLTQGNTMDTIKIIKAN